MPVQIEHYIDNPLARPMICILAAAFAAEHRKSVSINQILAVGAGPRSVKGRVLNQPNGFRGIALGDGIGARFHNLHCLRVPCQPIANVPFNWPHCLL